jgi:hypothetical protein
VKGGTQEVLYAEMLKALDGMPAVALLYYKMFRKDTESSGFVVNPYITCIANKMVSRMLMISGPVIMIQRSTMILHNGVGKTYDNEKTSHVTVSQGDKHDYLGMVLGKSDKGSLKLTWNAILIP